MILKITEDGMKRLAKHVKAQDDLSYDVENQMSELDMEDMSIAYFILEDAHDFFMTSVYNGIQKAISDGYLEKNIKGYLLSVLEIFDDEERSIRDQIKQLVNSK